MIPKFPALCFICEYYLPGVAPENDLGQPVCRAFDGLIPSEILTAESITVSHTNEGSGLYSNLLSGSKNPTSQVGRESCSKGRNKKCSP